MKKNIIHLVISNKSEFIMGNDYGKSVYIDQVQSKIKTNELNQIIFPNHVTFVAMSFVQGFIGELTKEFGRIKTFEIIELYSEHENLRDRLLKAMMF